MTETTAQTTPPTPAQAWRGIAAEDVDDIPSGLAALLRLRSRRLLHDLLRPHLGLAISILLLIVCANLAALAGPWLIGIGIDRVPQLGRSGNTGPLAEIIAAFAVAVIVQAVTTRVYIGAIGRLGADVVVVHQFGHGVDAAVDIASVQLGVDARAAVTLFVPQVDAVDLL